MIFYFILLFILGSAVGSFLNVVIDRSVRRETLMGRSYCDHCKKVLSPFDLLPILSFVALGGRCRYCRRPLSIQYPLVETLTGLLFAISFFVLSQAGQFSVTRLGLSLFLISVMIVVAFVDFKFSLIPTTFVYAAALVTLFYNFFNLSSLDFVKFVLAGIVAAVLFLSIVVFTRGKGMGEGDIPLAFLIGLTLGPLSGLVAFFGAFTSGAVVSIILIFLRRKKFGQTVPFAPFLVLGFLASLFWGQNDP